MTDDDIDRLIEEELQLLGDDDVIDIEDKDCFSKVNLIEDGTLSILYYKNCTSR